MADVLYPIARLGDKRIRIDNAEHGHAYQCLGCGGRMIPHLGKHNVWHFAHKTKGVCDRDLVTHRTCIEYVMWMFDESIPLDVICRRCRSHSKFQIPGDLIRDEVTDLIPPYRPDIVSYSADSPLCAIEVVNTHSMEDGVRAAYEKLGIPVLRVNDIEIKPNSLTFSASFVINIPPCGICAERARVLMQRERNRVLAEERMWEAVWERAWEQWGRKQWERREREELEERERRERERLKRWERRKREQRELEQNMMGVERHIREWFDWCERAQAQYAKQERTLAQCVQHTPIDGPTKYECQMELIASADKARQEWLEWKREWDAAHQPTASELDN